MDEVLAAVIQLQQNDFMKRVSIQCNNLTKKSKMADFGIPETPTLLELANVSKGDTSPLKIADVLNEWSLSNL